MVGVEGSFLIELGFILIIAGLAGLIFKLLKQPQILAYVLVGLLIKPILNFIASSISRISGFGFVSFQLPSFITDVTTIEPMAIIGITFLLFLVGLEMDLKSLKSVALVSTIGGTIQMIILFIIGYIAALAMGFVNLEGAYIGLFLAFSSTMVVMKLLSDKRELNTLHGRIAIGILLMQDIFAVLAISILSSTQGFGGAVLGIVLAKLISMFLVAYLLSKYVFPYIFKFAAKHQELLLVTSLAVCFTFVLAFHYFGLSVAIGAFLAGIALGNLEYNLEIIGRIKSLKDFFSLLFFVSLGMGISLSVIKNIWLPIIILLVIAIVIKPIVIMTICSVFKYTKKPSFLTANALAQVGEFSLILAVQGLALGHISSDVFSIAVILTISSIVLTSYYIEYNQWIYNFLKKPLSVFDIFTTEGLEYLPTNTKPKVILCGHNRIGYSILPQFSKRKKQILVVDYNPEVIAHLVKDGYHCIYGEATDEEIIQHMNLSKINLFISTIPSVNDNVLLLHKIRDVNSKAKVIISAGSIDDALRLYKEGANYVVLPHFLGGEHISNLITKMRKRKIKIEDTRKSHIKHLEQRKELGHSHPLHH